jgi:glutamate racemase
MATFTSMNSEQPIGFFDSGVGGTSIWTEVHALLPNEHTVYLADSENAPYGNKTSEAIKDLSIKNTERLIEMGCKAIVVACNTATTNAITYLRANYDVPFIGIEPAIKPAALKTTANSIGILATKGTLASALFHEASEAFTQHIAVTEVIGDGLVPLVEHGEADSTETLELLKKYVAPMIAAKIDYLVLGCTHYAYLMPLLEKLLPSHIKIIDSGAAVAMQTRVILGDAGLLRKGTVQPNLRFYTNTNTKTLEQLLAFFSGKISIETLAF